MGPPKGAADEQLSATLFPCMIEPMNTTQDGIEAESTVLQRGFLIYFLEAAPGASIAAEEFHVTLLGQLTDVHGDGFRSLAPLLDDARSFMAPELTPGEIEGFGVFGQHRVLTLNDLNGTMTFLHGFLLAGARARGFDTLQPQFAGANYSPHITLGQSSKLGSADAFREAYGESIRVRSVNLVNSSFAADGRFLSSEVVHSVDFR